MKYKLKRFNKLTTEELYKILKLRNEIFIVEQNCPYVDCDDKDYNAYHLFLEQNNNIVAYLRILDKGISYDEISVGRVVVSKDYRGKRIATEILLEAIKFIETVLNEKEIRISAQAHLIEFYGAVGFDSVSEEYLEDDIPHIEMLYRSK